MIINFDWNTIYNPPNTTSLAFMVAAITTPIKPAIRTLEIIEIDIKQEDFKQK